MEGQDRLEVIKAQNRIRAQRYYQANKEKIAEKRKAVRQALKQVVNTVPVEVKPVKQPVQNNDISKYTILSMGGSKVKPVQNNDISKYTIQPMGKVQPVKQEEKKTVPTSTLKTINNVVNYIKSENLGDSYINQFKQLADILDIVSIKTAFKNSKSVINKIESATLKNDSSKVYSVNSKKLLYQTILKLNNEMDLNLPQKDLNAYKHQFELNKETSRLNTSDNKNKEVMDFDDYLKIVSDNFETDSKENIIALLYKTFGLRDDLKNLHIISNAEGMEDMPDMNHILISKNNKSGKLIFNNYKTKDKYGQVKLNIPSNILSLIVSYMKNNHLTYGDFLFGKSSLSGFISNFNRKKLKLDITIDTYRHMRVAYELAKGRTAEDRLRIAKEMKHSTATSDTYDRVVKKIK